MLCILRGCFVPREAGLARDRWGHSGQLRLWTQFVPRGAAAWSACSERRVASVSVFVLHAN